MAVLTPRVKEGRSFAVRTATFFFIRAPDFAKFIFAHPHSGKVKGTLRPPNRSAIVAPSSSVSALTCKYSVLLPWQKLPPRTLASS
jgi:hypothetical protein